MNSPTKMFIINMLAATIVSIGTTYAVVVWMASWNESVEPVSTESKNDILEALPSGIEDVAVPNNYTKASPKKTTSSTQSAPDKKTLERINSITQEYEDLERVLNTLYSKTESYQDEALIPESLQSEIEFTQKKMDSLVDSL